uniref:Uncharacterized protein n=1 Tax=Arundo donax TaxID=35708 RepID=A0A0A9EHS0_ARUDO
MRMEYAMTSISRPILHISPSRFSTSWNRPFLKRALIRTLYVIIFNCNPWSKMSFLIFIPSSISPPSQWLEISIV